MTTVITKRQSKPKFLNIKSQFSSGDADYIHEAIPVIRHLSTYDCAAMPIETAPQIHLE